MEQISLFNAPKYKITKPVRLIELFGGYGSQHFALEYLGVNFQQWKLCEWAVKSIQAYKDAHCNDDTDYSAELSAQKVEDYLYNKGISMDYNEPMSKDQIHKMGEQKQRQIYNNIIATHNLVNIQQAHAADFEFVDTDKYTYLMTYSFPCQDLSLAGKGKGMGRDSGTRSGMLWEVERILKECAGGGCLPEVLLMENVPQVHGTKNANSFNEWCSFLCKLGYSNFYQDLNAKDYGVPQNRERCYMFSILGNYDYRFPDAIPLEHKLKDILEENVDESYYLSDKAINGCLNTSFNSSSLEARTEKDGVIPTLLARDYKDPKLVIEIKGKTCPVTKNNENYIEWKEEGFLDSDCRAWKDDMVSGTLTTNGKNKIAESLKRELCNKLIQDHLVEEDDVIRHSYTNNRLNNGVNNMRRTESKDKLCPTLDTRCDCLGIVVKNNNKRQQELADRIDTNKDGQYLDFYNQSTNDSITGTITTRVDASGNYAVYTNYRIRKLTPKECFRLMGVKDADFEKIAKNQSNASLYHLAGDSIVVNVLMAILKKLF